MSGDEARGTCSLALRERGFKVVEPLKCAGHAEIFRVQEQEGPDAEAFVAKVVSLTGLDAKGRAIAQQEVSLLKGLAAHPNLIAYRESFLQEAGILYIVMTLAEDGDLRGVVAQFQESQSLFPEPVVLSWTRQTLEGLKLLHGQGVVHRDLKSSNIFLCQGRRRILIGDFGISKVLESTAYASSCVGTPAYMSPELMRNERYDYHVDMWAMGCVVFELSTLTLPFKASSLLELACQVIERPPEWQLWQHHSEELRSVAERLLDKDPLARPTAPQVLLEPLFAPGGRGAQEPPEAAWACVEPRGPDKHRSPDKRLVLTQQSDLSTTPGTSEDSLSSKGGWTLTPRMPWEAPSKKLGASNGTTASFGSSGSLETAPVNGRISQELQARVTGQQLTSSQEVSEMLSSQQDDLMREVLGQRANASRGFSDHASSRGTAWTTGSGGMREREAQHVQESVV